MQSDKVLKNDFYFYFFIFCTFLCAKFKLKNSDCAKEFTFRRSVLREGLFPIVYYHWKSYIMKFWLHYWFRTEYCEFENSDKFKFSPNIFQNTTNITVVGQLTKIHFNVLLFFNPREKVLRMFENNMPPSFNNNLDLVPWIGEQHYINI